MSDWMQTASGRAYWPADPSHEDVDINDIAHALSMLCRYGGHSRWFYSVAEHSVLVSRMVPPEWALHGLLHDATEAYLVDVPRPIKRHLTNYKELEQRNWVAICDAFGMDPTMPDCVHDADSAILLAEKDVLMGPTPEGHVWFAESHKYTKPDVEIVGFTPTLARQFFLERFHDLTRSKQ
jgi:hypothetical protein